MNYSIRSACSALVCASACLMAAPGHAQINIKSIVSKAADDARAAAEKAAANANAAAAAKAAADKAHADIKAGIKSPEDKAKGARFTPAVVAPYHAMISNMTAAIKAVTNPIQAAAFLEKFRPQLPELSNAYQRAMGGYVDFENSGVKTPDNLAAEKMLEDAGKRAEALDNELTRVEKMHGTAKLDFQKFRDLHN